ncbi:hypothetical protein [uncultured Pseudokineococcus sp.]|uniref:hypothetical protein n=1 Tax=uncultured Pseudokineococcus sp. TaxID=1642928 RepID=UPI00261D27D8|nr:hypothetical protein [uncultured Pseudokineococcus sp.]
MVAPAPNLTRVTGTVARRRPHPALDAWDLVALAVESTAPVPGRADLVSRRLPPGAPLEVAVRRELLGDAGPGWRVDVRVRATPADVLAETSPAPGDLVLRPPPPG